MGVEVGTIAVLIRKEVSPVIIFGSTGLTKQVSSGRFYCPRCDDPDAGYDLKSVRRWFTLYFIPIFPISGHERYVECRHCRQAYQEGVLDLEPPAPASDADIDDVLTEMDFGASAEQTASRLEKLGVSPKETDRLIDNYTQGKVWQCERCDRHYFEKVKECPKCG